VILYSRVWYEEKEKEERAVSVMAENSESMRQLL
jgi:hypothetical protein